MILPAGGTGTATPPERGHSCPQQRKTTRTARRFVEQCEQLELAADKNVRAPVVVRPPSHRSAIFMATDLNFGTFVSCLVHDGGRLAIPRSRWRRSGWLR